ncbi:MAG TPA: tetratricopeptide repeat protein [Gemmataceae bacterium]|nr:tetratricopeptide repeat protein [Gemmataceae bacterium]
MRPSRWIAAAALLLSAGTAPAQVVIPVQARFGGQTSIFVQPRIGPNWGLPPGYWAPPFWSGPGWYPARQPIIIQNIIQTPPPIPVVTGPVREPLVPPEFDPPKPAVVNVKAPAKLPPRVEVEEPAKRALGRADADRIVEAGRRAFADGQYGRALELFRKAAEITPNEPSAYYLISQVCFALGKYRDAVVAIGAGVALRSDWSEARFNSRDLYGKTPAAFDEHLEALRRAATVFPDDPTLAFLLGHQLWFDGKHEEAKPFLLKARAGGKETPAIAFQVKPR